MEGRAPTVFISSTYFDLKQVRADIAEFIEDHLGYRLLSSEFNSFPVDPSLEVVENCRRQVVNEADLFVLIVGSRYGSIDSRSRKSVTNIEYTAARSKRIPVFAFVTSDVLAQLPVFERNPNADFSNVVDTPDLFRFVAELRGSSGVWTFKFDLSRDITSTLRTQLAYEMMRGLRLSAHARQHAGELRDLSGPAFRLVAEQPLGWEPLLLATIVEEEMRAVADRRRDHDLGFALGRGERLTQEDMPGWVASLMSEAKRLVQGITAVADASLNTALTGGEAEPIIYGARRMGSVYGEALDLIARIRRSDVPCEWADIKEELTHFLDKVFREFDDFVPRVKRQIQSALESPVEGTVRLPLVFKFEVADTKKIASMTHELLANHRVG